MDAETAPMPAWYAGRCRVTSASVCQWKLPYRWITPPRLADTAERDYFTLRERLITMQKQLEGTQKYINEQSAEIELPISMGNSCNYCEQPHTRFQRSINAQLTNRAIHLRMFAGFLFNNIFCAATNFGCIDSFLAQFQKRRNDGWWFWCYCCRFVLNSKRLLSTSCNKQASAEASSIFSWCYSRCFLKPAESYAGTRKLKTNLNNELKFAIVNIYYSYVRCDESSLYSRINLLCPQPWRGTSLRECPGIIKRCTQGLARTRIALCQRPALGYLKKPTLWFSVERFV